MKKFIVILCVAALCLMLCGCYSSSSYDSYGNGLAEVLEEYTLSEITDYLIDNYSYGDILDELDCYVIMEYLDEHGWIEEWNADHG